MFRTRVACLRNSNRFLSTARRWSSSNNNQNTNSHLTFFAWYTKKLETHPLLTKGISSGLIAGAGDAICQFLSVADDDDWRMDWARNGRFFVMGCFWVAPCTHLWYNFLNTRLFPGTSTVQRVTQRVVVDQFGFAVLFQPSFMGLLWLMEGRQAIPQQLMTVVPDVLVANWSLWIPAMSVNFAVVPLKFQVLFGNVVALLWNTYLSYVSAASKEDANY